MLLQSSPIVFSKNSLFANRENTTFQTNTVVPCTNRRFPRQSVGTNYFFIFTEWVVRQKTVDRCYLDNRTLLKNTILV